LRNGAVRLGATSTQPIAGGLGGETAVLLWCSAAPLETSAQCPRLFCTCLVSKGRRMTFRQHESKNSLMAVLPHNTRPSTPYPTLVWAMTYGRGVHPDDSFLFDGKPPSKADLEKFLFGLAQTHGPKPRLHPEWAEIDLTFSGNLIARPEFVLRDGAFRSTLAQYLCMLNLRGDAAYDWIVAMVYSCHLGDLFTLNDDWLDPDNLCPEQIWDRAFLDRSTMMQNWRGLRFPGQEWSAITFEMRELFGQEVRGGLNKFLRFAEMPPTRRADAHTLGQTMFIDFACRIHAGAILQEAIRSASGV